MDIGITLQIIVLVMSVVIHEVSHGYMAYWLGDPTAKYANRLNFNPVNHLDLWGSFLIPAFLLITNSPFLFGWAKPVPYNPYNLRNQKWGPALVGLAGPLSNLLLAIVAGVILRTTMVFGLVDGILLQFLTIVIFINILLMVFNLLPIPPLDGSKLLFAIIPVSEHTKMMLERYGFVFLIVFIYLFNDVFQIILFSFLNFFVNIIVGINLSAFFGLMG
jgi:Zn-dependent protease